MHSAQQPSRIKLPLDATAEAQCNIVLFGAAPPLQAVDSVASPEIIGHDCGFRAEVLIEDTHTSLEFFKLQWRSAYVCEAGETLAVCVEQPNTVAWRVKQVCVCVCVLVVCRVCVRAAACALGRGTAFYPHGQVVAVLCFVCGMWLRPVVLPFSYPGHASHVSAFTVSSHLVRFPLFSFTRLELAWNLKKPKSNKPTSPVRHG